MLAQQFVIFDEPLQPYPEAVTKYSGCMDKVPVAPFGIVMSFNRVLYLFKLSTILTCATYSEVFKETALKDNWPLFASKLPSDRL